MYSFLVENRRAFKNRIRPPRAIPDRDSIAGMKRAAAWLQEQGATVLDRIEDPDEGHGTLHRNTQNARRMLDLFPDEKH